jgi:acetolactate synthase-1/2/3 large subunit
MKVSHYVAQFLHMQGVRHVFEVAGGMITHLIDSLHQRGEIQIVSVHHEQAAAFAADVVGRMTGVPGVAMATSGPGATNLLTGIGGSYFDSTPTLFLTGQVNRQEQRGDRPIRQLGFQETDIVAMAVPITKAALRVQSPEEVPSLVEKAFALSVSGRPGPVLLDIPMDVQRAEISAEVPAKLVSGPDNGIDQKAIEELVSNLSLARRPLILAGGGIRSAQARDLLRDLVGRISVPVVHSLMAVDVLPYGHRLRAGMIGTYGNRWANMVVGRSDFLLVLGSRLDIRQTGSETEAFKGDRTIYHVDCELGEVNNRVTGCRPIIAHLRPFLAEAIRNCIGRSFPDRAEWLAEIEELRRAWPDTAELRGIAGINPNRLMHQLSAVSGSAIAFVVDVGQHQMWAGQSLELAANQQFLTSGGMGAMGFALPGGIGAVLASSGKPVVVIAGDGGSQLNIQELQTVVHNRIPLKMVILNNQCYGMVRQFQQSYFDERYQSTCWGYSAPDFALVAQAYGIDSHTVKAPADVPSALEQMWRDPASPFLLQVMIDRFANAYPKIAFGLPMTEMEPFAKPVDMKGI